MVNTTRLTSVQNGAGLNARRFFGLLIRQAMGEYWRQRNYFFANFCKIYPKTTDCSALWPPFVLRIRSHPDPTHRLDKLASAK